MHYQEWILGGTVATLPPTHQRFFISPTRHTRNGHAQRHDAQTWPASLLGDDLRSSIAITPRLTVLLLGKICM